MKQLLLIFLYIISTNVWAQSYNGPESVDYDPSSNKYFISNPGSGQILARESDGTLSVFANTGSGPHGIEVIGNEIYACSGSRLKAYDLNTGDLTVNINLGAGFANGITHKEDDIFITDFQNNRIYLYNMTSQNFNIYIDNFPSQPNGIFYDDIEDRLIVVSWGNNAPIYQIDPSNATWSLATNTSLGYCDGVAMNNNGEFYVSAWSNNAIHKFCSDFSSYEETIGFMDAPADIYYNRNTDTLAIPNSGNNTVVFLDLGSTPSKNCPSWNCVGDACIDPEDGNGDYSTLEECETNCNTTFITKGNKDIACPNPIKPGTIINVETGFYEIFNQNGQKVWEGKSQNKKLTIPNIIQGVYLLKNTGNSTKLIIQ